LQLFADIVTQIGRLKEH